MVAHTQETGRLVGIYSFKASIVFVESSKTAGPVYIERPGFKQTNDKIIV